MGVHFLSLCCTATKQQLYMCIYKVYMYIQSIYILCRPIGSCGNKHMRYIVQCLVRTRCFRRRNFYYYRVKSQRLTLSPSSSKWGLWWWVLQRLQHFHRDGKSLSSVLWMVGAELAVNLITKPCSLISLWQTCPLVPPQNDREGRQNWVHRTFICQEIWKWIL